MGLAHKVSKMQAISYNLNPGHKETFYWAVSSGGKSWLGLLTTSQFQFKSPHHREVGQNPCYVSNSKKKKVYIEKSINVGARLPQSKEEGWKIITDSVCFGLIRI